MQDSVSGSASSLPARLPYYRRLNLVRKRPMQIGSATTSACQPAMRDDASRARESPDRQRHAKINRTIRRTVRAQVVRLRHARPRAARSSGGQHRRLLHGRQVGRGCGYGRRDHIDLPLSRWRRRSAAVTALPYGSPACAPTPRCQRPRPAKAARTSATTRSPSARSRGTRRRAASVRRARCRT